MLETMNWTVEQTAEFQKLWATILLVATWANIFITALTYGKNRHKVKAIAKSAIASVQKMLETTLKIVEAMQYKRFAHQRLKEDMALKKLPPVIVEEEIEVIQPKPQPKKAIKTKKAKKTTQKPVRLTIHQELESNEQFQHLLRGHTLVQLRKMAKENNIRVYNVHGNGKHLNKAEIAALLSTV